MVANESNGSRRSLDSRIPSRSAGPWRVERVVRKEISKTRPALARERDELPNKPYRPPCTTERDTTFFVT